MTHTLKTWPKYFRAVKSGKKTFEVRRNDRDFKVGDTLILQEYDPDLEEFSGDEVSVCVTYILNGDMNKFGLFADFCVMSIEGTKPK